MLDAEEVEIAPLGKVKSEREVILESSHGQEFTLTAISREGISQRTVKTNFAPPFIKTFRVENVQNEHARLIWETLRADEARIEPNIGAVSASGEMQLPLAQLQSGIKLVATNKGSTVEQELRFEIDELPMWFARNVFVEVALGEKTFYAKVCEILFSKSGQLMFSNNRTINFTILYCRANRVYVKTDNAPSIFELSFCRNDFPLSNLDDLTNAM